MKNRSLLCTDNLILSFGVGLLLICLLYAFKWGLASVYVFQARSQIDQWELQGDVRTSQVSEASWMGVYEKMQSALALKPSSSRFFNYSGVVFEWGAQIAGLESSAQNRMWQDAVNSYQRAINLRPLSAYSWVNLFYVKTQLNQFDEELVLSAHKAVLHGGNEPYVQDRLMDAAFSRWSDMPASLNELILSQVQRNLFFFPETTVELLDRHQLRSVICTQLDITEVVENNCW